MGLKKLNTNNEEFTWVSGYEEVYNKVIENLDQRSPDVEKLIEVISNSENIPKYWADSSPVSELDYEELAKEIIKSMNKWIRKT